MLVNNHSNIIFLNQVSDHWSYLRQATVVICPSIWDLEGFGLVVTEAMAIGQAIVAFDRPPYNELIIHRHSALLAQDKDVTDLAKQIRHLLIDSALRQKLGQNAKQDFTNKYDIAIAAANYERALTQLQY